MSVRPVADKETVTKASQKSYSFTGLEVYNYNANQDKWNSLSNPISGHVFGACEIGYFSYPETTPGAYLAVGIGSALFSEPKELFVLIITESIVSNDGNKITFKGTVKGSNGVDYGSLLYNASEKTLSYSDSKGKVIKIQRVKKW